MAARDAPKTYHAWWLLAICAFGMAMVGIILWMAINTKANPGLSYQTTDTPYVVALSVDSGGDAARSGLRTGDLVDLRDLQPAARYRLVASEFVIGEQVTIPVLRHQRMLRFSLRPTTHSSELTWDVWLGLTGKVWVLAFAAVIAWRRPQNAEARLLSLYLSTSAFGFTLSSNNWQTRWPTADLWVNELGAPIGGAIFLFAAYAMLFARPPSRARRVLAWLAYVSCAFLALDLMAGYFVAWTAVVDPNSAVFGWTWYPLPTFAVLACAIAALVATRGEERTRLSWALASVGLWNVVYAFRNVATIVWPALVANATITNAAKGTIITVAPDVATFILPLGLTYSVLNRRLLDIGYALNRATIFTIVSVIIVGAFMLAEWLMGNWLASQSHVTNIVVSAALVVALGFSSRAIHRRVDRFVDTVFFRKRHEDETAIRDFAREAAFATDADSLLTGATATLVEHADAEHVSFFLDDGRGRYGDAGADDPAILALRTRHQPVDLHGIGSALRGEFAYPMAIGGKLVGVLVLGPKRSGESYAPDESHAIAALAAAVGAALALQALAPRGAGLQAPKLGQLG
jgi:hypothetical protein